MNDSSIAFDKWWGWSVGFLTLLFMIWFVIVEFTGFVTFFDFMVNAVIIIPESVRQIATYFLETPVTMVGGSMLVGAVFGATLTSIVYLSARNYLRLPSPGRPALIAGIITLVGAYLVGLLFLTALLLAAIVALVVGYVTQADVREFYSRVTIERLRTPYAIWWLGRGVLYGGVAGGLGSQILTYMSQHCTYDPEARAIEYQVGLVITAISALIFLIPLWTLTLRKRNRNQGTSGYFRGLGVPLAFLLPSLISLIIFLYYPAIQIATLSLKAQRFQQERFVCLSNYINLAENTIYRNSFLTTFALTSAIVLISMTIALGIAVLASQKVRGASIYRTLLIWPYALSPVVTGAIFLAMFRQGRSGLINYALFETIGITPRWLSDPTLALWVVIFASVWNVLGFNILFYIAGLQNVPKDLQEAAEIDGANRWQRFAKVTFPLLSPFTFFLLVTNVTYSFYGIYGAIDTLTQGGPPLGVAGRDGGATNVLIYKLYQDAFASGAQVGNAAAQSMILFVLVAGITLLQFRYIERRVTYAD